MNITQKDGLSYTYGGPATFLQNVSSGAGPHAVTSLSDGTVFKYDANGNMLTLSKANETTAYTYDVQNRLTSVASQTKGQASVPIAQYAYDGDGGRTKRTVYRRDKAVYNMNATAGLGLFENLDSKALSATSSNPTVDVTRYVGNVYEEESAGGSGGRHTKFIYLGSMRVAAVGADGSVYYYHADHLGGANALTDQAGLVRELTEYDPFGQVVRHEKYGSDFATAWYYPASPKSFRLWLRRTSLYGETPRR